RSVVVDQGDVVATSGGSHPFWIDPEVILKDPDNGSGPFGTKIPVIKDDPVASVRDIVRMAFHHEFKIRLVVHHFGNFAQNFLGSAGYRVASTSKQQFVGDGNKDNALFNTDLNVLIIQVAQYAF